MSKRILSLLAVFVLALVLSTAVSAQNVPDMSQDGTGSIHVNLNYAEGTSPRGSLTLYYVGEIAEDDGNYTFAPTGAFAEKWEVYDDVLSPELAHALAQFAAEGKLTGTRQEVGTDGSVTFSDLKLGLYLVVQDTAAEGYEKASPFLIGIPNLEDGAYTYQVDASPKVQLETTPTEPTQPTKPKPTEPKLPQTGQLNWPVPVLAVCGMALFIAGWALRFGRRKDGDA